MSTQSTWKTTITTVLAAATVVTLVLLAFAWPTYAAKVHKMPLGIVATSAQQHQVQQQLDAADQPFTLHTYANRADAVTAIEHRDVYGALVLPATATSGTEVLTASAGSTAATQMLAQLAQKSAAAQAQAAATAKQQAATQLAQLGAQAAAAQASAATLQQVASQAPAAQAAAMQPAVVAAQQKAAALGAQVQQRKATLAATPMPRTTVTDVVPLAATDSRGTGLAIAGLPLTMGGMIGGLLISMTLVSAKRRLAAVAGYGVLGGLFIALVLQTWFGFVQGSFAMTWLIAATSIAATASFIAGAHALLGKPGLALGAVLTMFVGNPISSLTMPKEWLPGAWGAIGQWFVPGASGTLLRDSSYFPHASTTQPWIALACWLVVGVALALVGHHRVGVRVDEADPAPVVARHALEVAPVI